MRQLHLGLKPFGLGLFATLGVKRQGRASSLAGSRRAMIGFSGFYGLIGATSSLGVPFKAAAISPEIRSAACLTGSPLGAVRDAHRFRRQRSAGQLRAIQVQNCTSIAPFR